MIGRRKAERRRRSQLITEQEVLGTRASLFCNSLSCALETFLVSQLREKREFPSRQVFPVDFITIASWRHKRNCLHLLCVLWFSFLAFTPICQVLIFFVGPEEWVMLLGTLHEWFLLLSKEEKFGRSGQNYIFTPHSFHVWSLQACTFSFSV